MRTIAVFLAVPFLMSCLHSHSAEAEHGHHNKKHHSEEVMNANAVEGPISWSAQTKAAKFHHHYFANGMDADAFAAAKKAGVKLVVDLRQPSEIKGDDKKVAASLGMDYHNVPMVPGKPLEKATIKKVETLFHKAHGENTLLYCSSGNRAGAWFAAHLATTHGLGVDEALAMGKKAGLTKPEMEVAVRNYVSSEQKAK